MASTAAAAAAVVNGTHSAAPPPPADATTSTHATATTNGVTSQKRKRDDDADGDAPETAALANANQQTQRDIFDILRQYDTSPSCLSHPFTNAHLSNSTGPSQKKAKLTDAPAKGSDIASRLRSCDYDSLVELVTDVQHVREDMVEELRNKDKQADGPPATRPLVENLKQIQKIQAFEQLVKNVVKQVEEHERKRNPKANALSNGETKVANSSNKGGTILTLFGNAPTPKQLFSSLQHSSKPSDTPIKSELPVEEMGLPTGLTGTKIVPAPTASQQGPTFGESFPPAHNLAPLNPPKLHKRSSTRDTVINWEVKEPAKGSKRGGYTTQKITSADWLGWGGVDAVEEPQSPNAKRKQRDRALSGGDRDEKEGGKQDAEEKLRKQEEALFRRAYSSFAPSHDNSKALVPAETMNMIWWQKVGEERYNERFAIDPALLDGAPASKQDGLATIDGVELNEEDLGKAIEELDQIQDLQYDTTHDKTDSEEVLRRISELLETLASQQRIRNSSLPAPSSTSRTPISPAPHAMTKAGTPSAPAEEEVGTYNTLRHELAYLILQLPPYAVAKLNSDQLSSLGVSKLLPLETKDIKGTMEDDLVARLAKYQAAATQASIATLARPSSSSTSQHYSTTANRTPAIGSAANTRYGQSANYNTGRTPSTAAPAYNRSISNQSQPQAYTPTAAPARPTQQTPYTRPPPPQPSYGSSATSQYYQQQRAQHQQHQQPPPAYPSYNQQYASTPQQQRPQYPPTASSQPLAQYQARSQAAAQNAISYQTNSNANNTPVANYARTASPAMGVNNAAGYATSQQQQRSGSVSQQYGQPLQQYPGQQPQYQQAPSGYGQAPQQYPQQHHQYPQQASQQYPQQSQQYSQHQQPQQYPQQSHSQYQHQQHQHQQQGSNPPSGRATPVYPQHQQQQQHQPPNQNYSHHAQSQPSTPQPPAAPAGIGAGYGQQASLTPQPPGGMGGGGASASASMTPQPQPHVQGLAPGGQ
ncbi:hypothetical protein MBLNU230_g7753t1 [Neophaeotheca triangularis]